MRPDGRTLKFFARLGRAWIGDDTLLSALAKELEGEGFRILQEGRVIILKGKSKVVLYEQPEAGSSDDGAAQEQNGGAGTPPSPEETNAQ